ncbi:hypothetical protein K438DRAFT_1857376 [Mycena galopus ATCC 62051]|nr:hypothetical protein K438DRAFT_1857376 [Mycena galopus ATCC 62051]
MISAERPAFWQAQRDRADSVRSTVIPWLTLTLTTQTPASFPIQIASMSRTVAELWIGRGFMTVSSLREKIKNPFTINPSLPRRLFTHRPHRCINMTMTIDGDKENQLLLAFYPLIWNRPAPDYSRCSRRLACRPSYHVAREDCTRASVQVNLTNISGTSKGRHGCRFRHRTLCLVEGCHAIIDILGSTSQRDVFAASFLLALKLLISPLPARAPNRSYLRYVIEYKSISWMLAFLKRRTALVTSFMAGG